MLKVNTGSTVNGTASISVGTIDTRATNQLCSRNSRQANGRRGMETSCPKRREELADARSGLEATPSETTAHALLSVAEPAVSSRATPPDT